MKSLKNYVMIGKIFKTGRSFTSTCRYVCEDISRAYVLGAEGVRTYNLDAMCRDFEEQLQLRPEKEKPVLHAVLSFVHGEQPSDDLLVRLGREYLERIEMQNTQYVLVKHTDKQHLHVHIIAN